MNKTAMERERLKTADQGMSRAKRNQMLKSSVNDMKQKFMMDPSASTISPATAAINSQNLMVSYKAEMESQNKLLNPWSHVIGGRSKKFF